MKRLGFRQILDEKYHNSCVLTNFAYLDDSKFDINIFYKKLTERGKKMISYINCAIKIITYFSCSFSCFVYYTFCYTPNCNYYIRSRVK